MSKMCILTRIMPLAFRISSSRKKHGVSASSMSISSLYWNLSSCRTISLPIDPAAPVIMMVWPFSSLLSRERSSWMGLRSRRSSMRTFLICLKLRLPLSQRDTGGTLRTFTLYGSAISVISLIFALVIFCTAIIRKETLLSRRKASKCWNSKTGRLSSCMPILLSSSSKKASTLYLEALSRSMVRLVVTPEEPAPKMTMFFRRLAGFIVSR